MSRKRIVAGNWKMNLLREEAQALVSEITAMLADEEPRNPEIILFPAFPHIPLTVSMVAADERIHVGGQNCADKANGALTGEVSAAMLRSFGCSHVLIGHSERRINFNESDALLAEKTTLALSENLIPVFCIGENLTERESGRAFETVRGQLQNGLFHLEPDKINSCILAYEPVWAIGTGLTASPEQAQEMHAFIRETVSSRYGNEIAQTIPILYGGSCNEKNSASLFSLPDVDGGLIGGASLKSRSFVDIVKSLP
jgi:triosephosphate isomerase